MFSRFRLSTFGAGVLKLGGGTALGQGLVVLTTPILTRLYTPAQMGILGVLMSFIGFTSVGVALRLDMAIVSAQSDTEADHLLAASVLATVPVSILSGLIMALLIHFNLLSYGSLPFWTVPAAVVTLVFTGLFTSLRYWFVRHSDFNGVSNALVSQGIGRTLTPVLLGVLNVGWIGLLLGEIAGRGLGIWRLIAVAMPQVRKSIFPTNRGQWRNTLSRNWKFPALVLPSSLVDAMGTMVSLPIIATLFGAAAAGQFLLVQRVVALPAGFVSATIADVFHAHLSDAFRSDHSKARPILAAVAKKLTFVSVAIYVPIAMVSPFVCGPVFGNEWADAGFLLSAMSLTSMVSMVVSPLSRLLLVVNRQELKLVVDFVRLVVPNSGLYICHYRGCSFAHTTLVFSVLSALSYGVYFLIIWRSSGTRSLAIPMSLSGTRS